MLTIVLKIILCSSILLGIYYWLLAKEKMFRFNRFYLLAALVFSYVTPFLTIKLPGVSQHKNQLLFDEIGSESLIKHSEISSFGWTDVLITIYVFICIILIIRIITSIIKIVSLRGIDIIYQNQKVRLIDANLPPFSFWNTMYLNGKYYREQKIDERIFLHEKTHITQKHTFDILFIAFLRAFSWINPVLYFYKKAITDNHEFLADDSIIQQKNDLKNYQNLILSEIILNQKISLTHQFNYNNTKKRFIMMNTKKSKSETIKKLIAVSAITGFSLLFVQKVYATENITDNEANNATIVTGSGLKSDTIPNNQQKAIPKTKLDKQKNVTTRELKENELLIPPPSEKLILAQYPEGNSALRQQFNNNFDMSNLNFKGTIKSKVYITIDEKGNTTNVKVDGENEAMNKQVAIAMNKTLEGKTWVPAEADGKTKATVFMMPITMTDYTVKH